MPYGIVTTAAARFDIQEAIDWENSRQAELGNRFFNDLDSKFSVISGSPYIFSIRYASVRCAGTNIFSYLIHYIVDEEANQIIILRVLHTSRKPVW